MTGGSDADLQTALKTFVEVKKQGLLLKYRAIHVRECVQVMLHRDELEVPLDPTQSKPSLSKKRRDSPSNKQTAAAKKVCISLTLLWTD